MPPFIAQNQARILPQRDIDVSGFAALIKAKRDQKLAEEQDQMSGQILQQGFQDPQGAAVEAFKTGDRGLAGLMLKQHQANIAAQQPKRVNPTALMQNLAAAGLKPGSAEYRDAILSGSKRGGMNITNVLPGSKKGTNKLSEKLAEQAAGVFDQASAAQDMASKYNQINQLAQNPNVRTGTLGNLELSIKKIGNTVFGQEFDGLAEAEQISKIGDLLVGDIRELQGDTRMSDSDRKAYRAIPPNLTDSKAGIAMASEIMQKTAVGMSKRQQALSQLLSQNGGNFDTQVYSKYQDYIRQNPLLTPGDLNKARNIASKTKQPLPGAGMKKSYEKWLKD